MSSPPEKQHPESKLPTMEDTPPGAPVPEQKQKEAEKGGDENAKTRAEIRWEGEGGNPVDTPTEEVSIQELNLDRDHPYSRPEDEVTSG